MHGLQQRPRLGLDLLRDMGLVHHLNEMCRLCLHIAEALTEPQFFFIKQQFVSGFFDQLPHPLARDADLLRDLPQGKIVIVVIVQHGSLSLREHLTVKVQ